MRTCVEIGTIPVVESFWPGDGFFSSLLGRGAWHQRLANKEVVEILPKGYVAATFADYLEVTLSYFELRNLAWNSTGNKERRTRLSAVAGVYLILDTKSGKQYVSSASGSEGIWGRWTNYASDGHGGNQKLRELIIKDTTTYPAAFRFSMSQVLPTTMPREEVNAWELRFRLKLGTVATGLNSN